MPREKAPEDKLKLITVNLRKDQIAFIKEKAVKTSIPQAEIIRNAIDRDRAMDRVGGSGD